MLGSAMLRFYVDIDKVSAGEGRVLPGLLEHRAFQAPVGSVPVGQSGQPGHPCPIQRAEWLFGHTGASSEIAKRH